MVREWGGCKGKGEGEMQLYCIYVFILLVSPYLCRMVKINNYTRKQPDSSNDYTTAYTLVNSLAPGASEVVTVDNIKVFRKYIYDLSYKRNMEFATRTQSAGIRVTRLS
jgi:hypothetical protein